MAKKRDESGRRTRESERQGIPGKGSIREREGVFIEIGKREKRG